MESCVLLGRLRIHTGGIVLGKQSVNQNYFDFDRDGALTWKDVDALIQNLSLFSLFTP